MEDHPVGSVRPGLEVGDITSAQVPLAGTYLATVSASGTCSPQLVATAQ